MERVPVIDVGVQYSGARAALRPVGDDVVAAARALGADVQVAARKTGVSLRRRKQFALIEVPSAQPTSRAPQRVGSTASVSTWRATTTLST